MATQTMQAIGPTTAHKMARKPLPPPPSPTLTNPDMVLPDHPRLYAPMNSPPRYGRRDRPPSPSYLLHQSSGSDRQRPPSGGSTMVTPKKQDKLGLMSRKMMLLRSRTASNGVPVIATEPAHTHDEFENFDSAYGSSPTLMDVGNLAPEQPDHRRTSAGGSSLDSDDMSSLPQFLAKYEKLGVLEADDEDDGGTPTEQNYEPSVDGGLEAHRRQAEEDEQTSALLSQRAEQILANAKKRLNLMEGNLRGARDLVQPLTTANLKRATSVGSSYISPARPYGSRGRGLRDSYLHDAPSPQTQQRLQAQASAPHLAQDYHQGHWRGFSETGISDRPYTAMPRQASPIIANGMIPSKAADPQWANALKGSKSYDSLGAMKWPSAHDPAYPRASPDPNLEPLVEDDGQYHAMSTPAGRRGSQEDGLGIYRSDSRSENLREQMSSLKGRISSLRERAREDSLRRQSMQNLREPSPLNNAVVHAPEFFYTSAPSYGQPPLDTNAGIGWTSQNNSPVVPQGGETAWQPGHAVTGSRNAFAEEEERMRQQAQQQQNQKQKKSSAGSAQKSSDKLLRTPAERQDGASHKRTPSGTAIVQSSKHSHHQQQRSVDSTDGVVDQRGEHAATNGQMAAGDEQSEAGGSVYEDAESDPQPPVVAHEDREDAFDYKNFFLHSAMKAYGRRDSSASSEDSTTSTATARGPTAVGKSDEASLDADDEDVDEERDEDLEMHSPPSSPETPERLRQIERSLHKRTLSEDSVSTLATFATATEGRDTPPPRSQQSSAMNRPIQGQRSANNSRPNSRPNTAIPIKSRSPIATSDTSSERADSGVGGLPQRSQSNPGSKKPALRSVVGTNSTYTSSVSPNSSSNLASPPMSPRALVDPATVAVNALLAPGGNALGLKDKALLFGLVESLTRVCHRLQDGVETEYEGRDLRGRLEAARRALEGGVVGPRPGSS